MWKNQRIIRWGTSTRETDNMRVDTDNLTEIHESEQTKRRWLDPWEKYCEGDKTNHVKTTSVVNKIYKLESKKVEQSWRRGIVIHLRGWHLTWHQCKRLRSDSKIRNRSVYTLGLIDWIHCWFRKEIILELDKDVSRESSDLNLCQ